jgi:hypothetical protein
LVLKQAGFGHETWETLGGLKGIIATNLLGYETSVPFSQGFKYRVLGNDINGFAGWADIIPKDGNYVLKVHYY